MQPNNNGNEEPILIPMWKYEHNSQTANNQNNSYPNSSGNINHNNFNTNNSSNMNTSNSTQNNLGNMNQNNLNTNNPGSMNQNNEFNTTFNSVDDLLKGYILEKIGNKNLLHKNNGKTFLISRIILSIITFLIITYLALYHDYFGGFLLAEAIAIGVYLYSLKNVNMVNTIKKEIISRPDDNIDYIIASFKQSTIDKKSLKSKYILPLTLIISICLFSHPHIIYEKNQDGYAIRYYTLAIFNESNVVLPESHNGEKVVEIRGSTFKNLKSLKTIVLPQNIKEIRGNTFENSGIESITIPNGVTRIGGHAFYGCYRLKNVELPDTLQEIGSSAFRQCGQLKSIRIPSHTFVNQKAFKESPTNIERY